jgi:hypothetical protein
MPSVLWWLDHFHFYRRHRPHRRHRASTKLTAAAAINRPWRGRGHLCFYRRYRRYASTQLTPSTTPLHIDPRCEITCLNRYGQLKSGPAAC